MNALAQIPPQTLTLTPPTIRPLANQSKQAMTQEYVHRWGQLRESWSTVERFLQAIDECNGFPLMEHGPPRRESGLSADVIASPDTHRLLSEDLQGSTDDFYCMNERALQWMQQERRIGGIQWVSPTVVRYCWFMLKSRTELLGRKGDFDHFQKTTDHVGIVHELMNARKLPITANIKMPQRVKTLLAAVPSWLKSYVTIVDGTLIREVRVAKEVKKETFQEYIAPPKYEYDPAVCFANYCLTGWHPNEA